MALVRVYCGLTSADSSAGRAAGSPELAVAVVDDTGRLLGVHEVTDDPAGYAWLGAFLAARSSGLAGMSIAADSDDHLLTSLCAAAGRPLAVADDDSVDDCAERFADDDSLKEIQAPQAYRRAVGLARALQAGALDATTLPTPRELASHKPILAGHAAMLTGRHAAATALREVLRELYPAALRAYPDPAQPLPMAVLEAFPEPGRLHGSAGRGRDADQVTEEVVSRLAVHHVADPRTIEDAVTALRVAVDESPRRGGVNKSLAGTVADAVGAAIAAVRSCDAACDALLASLAARSGSPTGIAAATGRRSAARRAAEIGSRPTSLPTPPDGEPSRMGRRSRPEPAATGGAPALPHPLTTPPVAPQPLVRPPVAPRPVAPPPVAPAAAARLPNSGLPNSGLPNSGLPSRPVSAPPPPPPGILPAPRGNVPPAEAGQPFRPTITNAAINSARAERQRTVIPPRPVLRPQPGQVSSNPMSSGPVSSGPVSSGPVSSSPLSSSPVSSSPLSSRPVSSGSGLGGPGLGGPGLAGPAQPSSAPPIGSGSVTDYSPPILPSSTGSNIPTPGSRDNWPLANQSDDRAAAAPTSTPPSDGRVRPPWQSDDLPAEPPSLRLVEPQPDNGRLSLDETTEFERPLRLVDGEAADRNVKPPRRSTLTALDRSAPPPIPDEGDGDLLIFAEARSAWFVGHTDDDTPEWQSQADTGWAAAEQAARPAVGDETSAGLPKRVPQANLVPGSPLRDERPLRIVRDAASIAAHTTGYFRGWRRGQEIGGYAIGGRPGREAAGGWDFTRDGGSRDDDYRPAGYPSS